MTEISGNFEQDDQVLFNNALKTMNISWTRISVNYENSSIHSSFENENIGWIGHTSGAKGLKVTLLPQGVACRGQGCVEEMRERVYIWHHGGNRHRIDNMSNKAGQDGVWFLRKDWESEDGRSYGIEWLSRIAIPRYIVRQ